MIVLNRSEMYRCDAETIKNHNIPGIELMENAGKNSAVYIQDSILSSQSRVIIFCGTGNNGGDGFVIARYLKEWGHKITVILTGKEEKMSPETKSNYLRCKVLKIPIYQCISQKEWLRTGLVLEKYDLTVDAIFGVGFRGELRDWPAYLIKEINEKSKLTVAVDIASGTDADNGLSKGGIRADYTLTMAALKYGSLLGEGFYNAGKKIVIDIGMPKNVITAEDPSGLLLEDSQVKFPCRKKHSHKGNYGRIAIIAGSPGFSGAAVMAARAALRSGAGLITLFHPKGMEMIFEVKLLEIMTRTIPEKAEEFLTMLDRFDAILFGPGTGTDPCRETILKMLINEWNKPLVIDADGLNILAAHQEWLTNMKNKSILLTPHIGEFARLTDKNVEEIIMTPVDLLQDFSKKYQVKVLLKSSTTIFSDGRRNILEISGNDGLATGGSGDVLAGIIISFIGQGLEISQAALSGSWLLGKTAEKLSSKRQTASIIPSDIIDALFTL